MNVIQALRKCNPEQLIYLGTEMGSCWLCILPNEKLITKLTELNSALYDDCIKEYKFFDKKVDDFVRSDIDDETKYKTYVSERNKLKNQLENWIDVSEREIISVRKSLLDSGILLTMQGIENGKMCLVSEQELSMIEI